MVGHIVTQALKKPPILTYTVRTQLIMHVLLPVNPFCLRKKGNNNNCALGN